MWLKEKVNPRYPQTDNTSIENYENLHHLEKNVHFRQTEILENEITNV